VPSSGGKVEEMLLLRQRLRLKEQYEVQGAGWVSACSATRRVAKPTRQRRENSRASHMDQIRQSYCCEALVLCCMFAAHVIKAEVPTMAEFGVYEGRCLTDS
jgi:hypothetical protein